MTPTPTVEAESREAILLHVVQSLAVGDSTSHHMTAEARRALERIKAVPSSAAGRVETASLPGCPRCGGAVYWLAESQNFYCAGDNKGCGTIFYEVNRTRQAEFPQGRALASPPPIAGPTKEEVASVLKPFADVADKAKGNDDACWCGQDGAVIRYRDLRAARDLLALFNGAGR